jgi:hypothetical protein
MFRSEAGGLKWRSLRRRLMPRAVYQLRLSQYARPTREAQHISSSRLSSKAGSLHRCSYGKGRVTAPRGTVRMRGPASAT